MGLAESYDEVADEYAAAFLNELARKPLDRALLKYVAEEARGRVLEVGCGSGQVARHLHSCGADVEGIDLSPRMIEVARRHHPDIPFRVADMTRLPQSDGELAAVVAFYAIVNLPTDELTPPLREFRRVLRPGGLLLLSFHVGTHTRHVDELLGKRVSMDFHFHPREAVEDRLAESGFAVEAVLEREPVQDAEFPSRRAYIVARPRGSPR